MISFSILINLLNFCFFLPNYNSYNDIGYQDEPQNLDLFDNIKIKRHITYYSNGQVKEIKAFYNGNNYDETIALNREKLTILYSIFENDSIAYVIKYDSLGKKIEDKRKVFHYFDNYNFRVGDSVCLNLLIFGPDSSKIKPIAEFYQKESRNGEIINTLNDVRKKGGLKASFMPSNKGKYTNKIGFIDILFEKNIAPLEIIFEVK